MSAAWYGTATGACAHLLAADEPSPLIEGAEFRAACGKRCYARFNRFRRDLRPCRQCQQVAQRSAASA